MPVIEITDEMRSAARTAAARWNIADDLHEEDQLLRHVSKRWGGAEAAKRYIEGGRNDAAKMRQTIEGLKIPKEQLRILDFAAGFGRVVRHLDYLMPAHEVIASDIHPKACDFLRDRLGIPAFVSDLDPGRLEIGEGYDVIYVMSLFSHLPDRSFGSWLGALYRRLAPGGYLIFTANGTATLEAFGEFYGSVFGSGQGFGYRAESDQLDIDSEHYGSMIVSVEYVVEAIRAHAPEGVLHRFASGGWFATQDEWIVRRPG